MTATLILTSCPAHPTTLLVLLQEERRLCRNAWIYTRQKTVAIWGNALHFWYCSIPRLKIQRMKQNFNNKIQDITPEYRDRLAK